MSCRPSTSDQVRASAICPTAAAPRLSSSLSGPAGSLSTARPRAMAPDETTRRSHGLGCRPARPSETVAGGAARGVSFHRQKPRGRSPARFDGRGGGRTVAGGKGGGGAVFVYPENAQKPVPPADARRLMELLKIDRS